MRRILLTATLLIVSSFVSFKVLAACGSYFTPSSPDTFSGGPCPNSFSKTAHWDLFFTDGHETRNLQVTENGECMSVTTPGGNAVIGCYPGYNQPYWMETTVGKWNQVTTRPWVNGSSSTGWTCSFNTPPFKDHIFTYNCRAQCQGSTDYTNYSTGCIGGFTDAGGICDKPQWFINKCYDVGEEYSSENCNCNPITPILIDVNGDGFSLTDVSGGVSFDLKATGTPSQFAWTSPASDDAFLTLDRNGNGTIDDGKELFGDVTSQPAAPEGEQHNGFIALSIFDSPGSGGNGDGEISPLDGVFESLRLWQDINHNGVSEPNELHTLNDLGLKAIELKYKPSPKVDLNGNRFRFRAKVKDINNAQLGRWAWDVILRRE